MDLKWIFFVRWAKAFNEIKAKDKVILTTEKDAVRLIKFTNEIKELPFYVVPIRHQFLFGDKEKFDKLVVDFINNFRQSHKK